MVGGSFRDLVFFLFFLKVSFSFLSNLHVSVGRGGREGCRTLARCTKFTGIGGGDAQLDSPLGSVASVCFLPAFIVTSLCSSSRVPLPEKGQVTSLLVLKVLDKIDQNCIIMFSPSTRYLHSYSMFVAFFF